MVEGIGTDIIEVERVRNSYKRYKQTFLDKVFTRSEQEYVLRKKDPAESLAARFAAKEATVKALGKGFGAEIAFTDIEVVKDENGLPHIRLAAHLQKKFNNPQLLVSLSHCKSYATATVIWIVHA